MACCDFPLRLLVDTSELSTCSGEDEEANDCASGGSRNWDGLLRDYDGTRCSYSVDDFNRDSFDGKGFNAYYTRVRRSNQHECGWILQIACSHCALNNYIWAGFGPHWEPQGIYRVLYACGGNMLVSTVDVKGIVEEGEDPFR